MLKKSCIHSLVNSALITGAILGSSAQANIIRINEDIFTAQAGKITFSEFTAGTVNPVYTAANYEGEEGSPTVSFGGRFIGQSAGEPSTCAAGAAVTGCVIGLPTGELTLDKDSPDVFISADGANPTSPALSGTPLFNGAISILFDIDLVGVGLYGGYFDAMQSTAIRAFDRQGGVLGTVVNEGAGFEFLGLMTADGAASIAGLQFMIVGPEPDGFAIDNLIFAKVGQVNMPPSSVPLPAAWPLFASALGLGAIVRRRR